MFSSGFVFVASLTMSTGFDCCHGGYHAGIRQRLASAGSGLGWICYFGYTRRIDVHVLFRQGRQLIEKFARAIQDT